MRACWWTGSLLVALVGCSSVDPRYSSYNRPLVNDRTLSQLPPSSLPSWQQNQNPLAYRTPPSPVGFPTGYSVAGNPALGQPLTGPSGGVAMNNALPGQPVPDTRSTAAAPPASGGTDSAFSQVQRAAYEERPLRGVAMDGQTRVPDLNRTPAVMPPAGEMPRPLLMAGADSADKAPPGDGSSARQALRPAVSHESQDAAPRPATSPTVTPGASERETSPLAQTAKPDEAPSALPAASTHADERTSPGGIPPVRMVNNKRIVLNYELKDVGPTGVSAVDLWYTRDGRTWTKDESATKQAPPYVFTVPEEGMYGFTLLAKNGMGLGKQPPQPGDLPQVWVEVDMTRPVVSALEVKNGQGQAAREVTVTWKAEDRNLARKPITICCAEKPDGPWVPVATNIENSGSYTWTVQTTGMASFFTRVEAADQAGNVGTAQTAKALSIDTSQPVVNILNVEASDH